MNVKIIENVLEANNYIARKLQQDLKRRRNMMVNIIGSPGAGKTSFILKSIQFLDKKCAVIEGDIASDIDSKKVASYGIPVVQVNTGGGCHLSAPMIDAALKEMNLEDTIIFVENVGNLVCPASFDIGEDFKVVLSSVTEGDDKPYKYPAIFKKAKAVVMNKMDLNKHIKFDKNYFYRGIKMLNSNSMVFEVSSTFGEGMKEWSGWLTKQFEEKCPL